MALAKSTGMNPDGGSFKVEGLLVKYKSLLPLRENQRLDHFLTTPDVSLYKYPSIVGARKRKNLIKNYRKF